MFFPGCSSSAGTQDTSKSLLFRHPPVILGSVIALATQQKPAYKALKPKENLRCAPAVLTQRQGRDPPSSERLSEPLDLLLLHRQQGHRRGGEAVRLEEVRQSGQAFPALICINTHHALQVHHGDFCFLKPLPFLDVTGRSFSTPADAAPPQLLSFLALRKLRRKQHGAIKLNLSCSYNFSSPLTIPRSVKG